MFTFSEKMSDKQIKDDNINTATLQSSVDQLILAFLGKQQNDLSNEEVISIFLNCIFKAIRNLIFCPR